MTHYLLLIAGIIAVGFSGPFNAIVVGKEGFTGLQTASSRLLLASFILLCFPQTRRHLVDAWPHRGVLLTGSLCLAIHFALWTTAFEWTTLSSAVMFLCAQPLISWIFTFKEKKEAPTKTMIVGFALSMLGLFLLAFKDFQMTGPSLIGDLMVVLATVAIVLYQITTREVNRKLSWPVFNACLWGLSGLLLFPFARPFPEFSYENQYGWQIVIALTLIPTFIGHGAFNRVIPHLKLLLINISILIEPVLGIFIGVWMGVDEIPKNERLLGIFCVLIGVGCVLINEGYRALKIRKH